MGVTRHGANFYTVTAPISTAVAIPFSVLLFLSSFSAKTTGEVIRLFASIIILTSVGEGAPLSGERDFGE